MEAETQNNFPSMFSLEAYFSQVADNLREILFKSKWKQLSIQQGDKILSKLHPEVLEEDFPETLQMFESNSQIVSLPHNFDTHALDLLMKYFYFREINPPISIHQTFQLLNLAVYFKVQFLINEIEDFLIDALYNKSETEEIFQHSFHSYLIFQSTNKEIFQNLLTQSMTLLKSNKKEEILKYFSVDYFKKLENTQMVEENFKEILNSYSNETLIEDFEEKLKFLETEKNVPTFASETIKFGELSLSNSNRTVERINFTGYYSGIQCTGEYLRSSDKQIFSIKIERTAVSAILFGFCVKYAECDTASASITNGYHSTKFSFMLFLYDGSFWSRSSSSKYITTFENLRQAIINPQTVFSASLDTTKNQIKFYMNGKLLAPAIEIDLTKEESKMMCPCVDLAHQGDRVSLVFQELLE